MPKYKYKCYIEESTEQRSEPKLDFSERIRRVSTELELIFHGDPQIKINMDEDNQLLTVESSLLSEEEIYDSIEKCLSGLDLSCAKVIKSSF